MTKIFGCPFEALGIETPTILIYHHHMIVVVLFLPLAILQSTYTNLLIQGTLELGLYNKTIMAESCNNIP